MCGIRTPARMVLESSNTRDVNEAIEILEEIVNRFIDKTDCCNKIKGVV